MAMLLRQQVGVIGMGKITYEVAVYSEDASRIANQLVKLINEDEVMQKAPERVRMAVICAALGTAAQCLKMADGLINVTNGWRK